MTQLGFDDEPQGCPSGSCSHALAHHDESGRCIYPDCFCGQRDAAASARERDKGMVRAAANPEITDDWKATALAAVEVVACRQEYVSSVDVVEYLHEAGEPPPPGSRVMGPLMRRAATLGYIEGPVSTRNSDRVTHHRGLENVWRSKLWRST